MQYPINNIYSCVQGEGCQTGVPMVMLRLQGCDVGCPWCDTKETWKLDESYQVNNLSDALGQNPRWVYQDGNISYYIANTYKTIKWVLISGGEPAQYDLLPLTYGLTTVGKKKALETSGTELGHLKASFDWVCVSPKINMPGGKEIKPEAFTVADEIKHVVGKESDIVILDDLLKSLYLKPSCQILLQPVSQSKKATQLCIEIIQERGWRLSVQVHKYLDIA